MREYYLIEEEDAYNGGEEYESYDEALVDYKKTLHDLSNYHYQANKDRVYTLSKVIFDPNTDEREFCTLKSITVEEYKQLDWEEKENFFENIEKEEDYEM